jgi:hypothetical protein
MKLLKKILIVIIFIFVAYVAFAVSFFMFNGYYWQSHLYYIKWNLSKQSTFETDSFIVNLPKLYWIGLDNNSAKKPLWFVGLPVKGLDMGIAPILTIEHFDSIVLEDLKIFCDNSFEKQTEKFDNKDVDVYICTTKSKEGLLSKFIVHKDEALYLIYYSHDIDVFNGYQSQYDKFFEGVKLKK